MEAGKQQIHLLPSFARKAWIYPSRNSNIHRKKLEIQPYSITQFLKNPFEVKICENKFLVQEDWILVTSCYNVWPNSAWRVGTGTCGLRWTSIPAVQERVAKLQGMLHATETWINSGRLGLWHWPFCTFIFLLKSRLAVNQAPVVQTLDSAIHRINHYPADKYYGNQLRYPLDSDLSAG